MPDQPTIEAIGRQEQLLPFLLNPHSYPHQPRTVRLVQTHASYVFIAPPFVYKVKKPVNFGFLNFSTLEKRRHFCEREVALNRRLCPRMYLGVTPISLSDGRLAFGESGQVVEYAVQMRQLPNGRFLDQLVHRKAVQLEDLDRIIRTLKDFYEAQHPSPAIESWGEIARLRISTDENYRQSREFLGHTVSRPALETISYFTNRFYARHKQLFTARIREQRIRDCHGDLHLEHIHLTPGELHIYDCIEFNDRFRYVDVANDVAFLAMDLDYEGRPDLAHYFASRMSSALNDSGMLRLLDFYKCYRACVRGKVESLHSLSPAAPAKEREQSAVRARRYFRLALNYAVAGSNPLLLAVIGRIASGKSTLAHAIAAELGWEIQSSDRIRKETAGFPLYERRSAAARTRLYSKAMTEETYNLLLSTAEVKLQQGQSVILDATFADRSRRHQLAQRCNRRGFAWSVIEAQASDMAVKRRLHERETKPDEISDARLEDFEMLTRRYETPVELSASQAVKIHTVGTIEKTVTKALQSLARLQIGRLQTPL